MTARMNWDKARRRPQQSKFAGQTLASGQHIPDVPQDDLARRARQAMRDWARRLSPRDRQLFR